METVNRFLASDIALATAFGLFFLLLIFTAVRVLTQRMESKTARAPVPTNDRHRTMTTAFQEAYSNSTRRRTPGSIVRYGNTTFRVEFDGSLTPLDLAFELLYLYDDLGALPGDVVLNEMPVPGPSVPYIEIESEDPGPTIAAWSEPAPVEQAISALNERPGSFHPTLDSPATLDTPVGMSHDAGRTVESWSQHTAVEQSVSHHDSYSSGSSSSSGSFGD